MFPSSYIEDGENYKKRIQELTSKFSSNMLGLDKIPLYSKYVPISEHNMNMSIYEQLICRNGMTFKKLMRLTAIGMMKVLGSLSKGKLHQIESIETEVFNLIVLCAQKARPIDTRQYENTNVIMVGNVLTLRFGKGYKTILPVIEDSRLIEKLIT